jgi:A/G-specific adenine glycosylase
MEASEVLTLPRFAHAFTHFTLDVAPWRVEARRPAAVAGEREILWLALDDIDGAALPSPVRRLLASLRRDPAGAGNGAGKRAAASRR